MGQEQENSAVLVRRLVVTSDAITRQRLGMPSGYLRHYKGGTYQVLLTCVLEADVRAGVQVVYQALAAPYQTYVRPLVEFTEEVTPGVQRFVYIESLTETA